MNMDTNIKSQEKFVDFDKCMKYIDEVKTKLANKDENKCRADAEKLIENFRKTVDQYQEQPELLDPYVQELIAHLVDGLESYEIHSVKYNFIFKFLYQLIKVVGFKSIGKKFPHETDKLPLILDLLAREKPEDKLNWQTRYVLTVWLSIVILTPFDLVKFGVGTSEQVNTLLMKALDSHDSCQHVTSYCLAKYFSRPDTINLSEQLDRFIDLALEEVRKVTDVSANSQANVVKTIGLLRTLAYIFKYLPRDQLKARSPKLVSALAHLDAQKISSELINHLLIKLTQRIGLALLPKRLADWRYKRGARILGQIRKAESSVETSDRIGRDQPITEATPLNNEEEVEASEQLESIFNILLVAAQNAQTKIRWSAAKGVARLASRLSRDRAGEVIDMVLTNFFDSNTSSEYAWHGGCLALAEMSRQGLILEEKLPQLIGVVGSAIIYDKIKGSFAVGAHVREAACYVCWAVARTYEDKLLEPYISSISINLLCTMLFDRELQCRRAASATFQELVGRQGTYNEEGINILTNVDYQNVGARQFAYSQLALQVASYSRKYSRAFIEHLISTKIGHWDVQIRRLASDSLSALMLHCDAEFVSVEVLPRLIDLADQQKALSKQIASDNNYVKHGALLSLAKVIRGLVPLNYVFEKELVEFVGDVTGKCEKQLKSKQQANNFLEAICQLVISAEVAKFRYDDDNHGHAIVQRWEKLALLALDNDNDELRDIGSDALLALYRTFYRSNKTCQDHLLTTLNKNLVSLNESTRCGALRALSKLGSSQSAENAQSTNVANCRCDDGSSSGGGGGGEPTSIKSDADTPDIILMSLTSYISKETHERNVDVVFAQAKSESCEALVNFVKSLDKQRLLVSSGLIRAGLDALIERTEDYTIDKRGDIGVVVRKAAVKALVDLVVYLISVRMASSALFLDKERMERISAKILQQCVSYHNSARELAAQSFYRLVEAVSTSDQVADTYIPHLDKISELFKRYNVISADKSTGLAEEAQVEKLEPCSQSSGQCCSIGLSGSVAAEAVASTDAFNWRDDSTPIFVNLLSKPEYSHDLWIGLLPAVSQVSDIYAKQFRDALSDYIRSLDGESSRSSCGGCFGEGGKGGESNEEDTNVSADVVSPGDEASKRKVEAVRAEEDEGAEEAAAAVAAVTADERKSSPTSGSSGRRRRAPAGGEEDAKEATETSSIQLTSSFRGRQKPASSTMAAAAAAKGCELEQVFESFLATLERADLGQRMLTMGLIVADFLLTSGLLRSTRYQFRERLARLCWNSINTPLSAARANSAGAGSKTSLRHEEPKRPTQSATGAATDATVASASVSSTATTRTISKYQSATNDTKRLTAASRVFSSMLQFKGQVQRDCLDYCLTLLLNRYATVRAYTAEQLYLSLMTYQTDLEDNIGAVASSCSGAGVDGTNPAAVATTAAADVDVDVEGAMDLLSETNWSEPLDRLRPVVGELRGRIYGRASTQ